ncbi:hypothetical protein BWU74_12395 [Paraburkholderia caledonica]|nr:hypothetical protein BWU74_12395 [Burkholderia sp. Bk]
MQVNELVVGLNSWVIQDGNYDDFQVGASYKLALEFNGSAVVPYSTHVMQCERNHASVYNVIAKVIFATPKVWVIDFGVKVYCKVRTPRSVRSGDWVKGEIWIGVDPFFYKERLNQTPGMPDLFVDWSVTRIQLVTTPWIEDVSSGRKLRMRETEHESWTDRASTDAWTDDGGGADYLLSLSR